jgi:hypothetical protein
MKNGRGPGFEVTTYFRLRISGSPYQNQPNHAPASKATIHPDAGLKRKLVITKRASAIATASRNKPAMASRFELKSSRFFSPLRKWSRWYEVGEINRAVAAAAVSSDAKYV